MRSTFWKDNITAILGGIVIFFVVAVIGFGIYATIINQKEQSYITSGYVVDKDYQKGYTSYIWVGSGDTRHTIPQYHAATYSIMVESDDKNHCAYYEVTPEVYDRIRIGDYLQNVNRELK